MLFFLIVIMKHMGSILCIDTPMYYANQNSFLSPLWYYGNMSKPIMTSLPWSCCVHFFYNGIFMIYIYISKHSWGINLWDFIDRFSYLKVSCAIVLIIPNCSNWQYRRKPCLCRFPSVDGQQTHSLQIQIQYIQYIQMNTI